VVLVEEIKAIRVYANKSYYRSSPNHPDPF
jgi:hypothetical protein